MWRFTADSAGRNRPTSRRTPYLVDAITFSADGSLLVTGGMDRGVGEDEFQSGRLTVRFWDVTGKRPRELLVAEPKFRPRRPTKAMPIVTASAEPPPWLCRLMERSWCVRPNPSLGFGRWTARKRKSGPSLKAKMAQSSLDPLFGPFARGWDNSRDLSLSGQQRQTFDDSTLGLGGVAASGTARHYGAPKHLQKVWSLPRMAKRSSQAAMPLAAEVKSCNGMWRPDAASDRSWFRMGWERVSLWRTDGRHVVTCNPNGTAYVFRLPPHEEARLTASRPVPPIHGGTGLFHPPPRSP